MNLSQLSLILERYGIHDIISFLPVEGGIINQTYVIETGLGKFVLQGLSPATSPDAIITQYLISKHCREMGVVTPSLCRDISSNLFTTTSDKINWKLTKWINHGSRPSASKSIEHAAVYLARFHQALRECDHLPPQLSIPHFHAYREIGHTLQKYLETASDEFAVPFGKSLIEQLLGLEHEPIRTQLIHGDPKWNNFLFKGNGDVAAIIDLDTLMVANIMIDIGDAFRSWCKTSENCFDRNLFGRALSAYNMASDIKVDEEIALRSTVLLALELSARFLIDVFEDSYFGWDTSKFRSRKDHNLFRAHQYFKYAASIINPA